MTNQETIDLCDSLGIGVKSHSSSIVEPQADRARRKAKREGLIREVVEEPPAPEPEPEPAPEPEPEPAPEPEPEPEPVVVVKEPTPVVEKPAPEPAVEEPLAAEPVVEAEPVDPAPIEPPTLEPAPAAPKRVVTSRGSSGPRPAATPAPAEPKPARRPAEPEARAPRPTPGSRPAPVAKPDPDAVPKGPSGKPIPPPPVAPRSLTGKPIPPPPGLGGREAAASKSRPRPGAGGAGASAPGGGGAPRPGAGAGAGAPGRPGPGGRGGLRQPPRRRKSRRRRRNQDDLRPAEVAGFTPENAPIPTGVIVVERATTPQELGEKFNRTAADVVRFLMLQGEMVTATQSLSDDMIELFAAEIGAEVRLVDVGEEQEVELQKILGFGVEADDEVEALEGDDAGPIRAPVVTIMGHVDHGKTKLLDTIRNADVVAGEAGGITQHIGAYQTNYNGNIVTFIDTPGHEAFTAMRMRGAQATDIVILVVAADDGVMPQTEEAISHAKAAGVPIIVAVNKIDRENADPQRVLSQLAERDLVPEAWGGDTIVCEISALQNIGIDELLEQIITVAEVEEYRAIESGRARGVVLESHLDIGRGPVATMLVQSGVLRVGDPVVAGAAWGRVRALVNDLGESVKQAPPSTPVEVLGLSEVCAAGDEFVVAQNEKTASRVADTREHWQRQANIGRSAGGGGTRLEDVFGQIQMGNQATLNLIVKADVNGSLEAVTDSLRKVSRDEVKIAFVHRGVGGITENDVQLAAAAEATIVGFNVRPDRKARKAAEQEDVEIRTYEIIYKLIEDIEDAVVGLLAPEFEEVVTGEAEVREVFKAPKIGAIAGCMVVNGTITRGSKVRFLRDGTVIWNGDIQSLRRFKDDVREVASGFECGIGLSDFQDLKAGDIIETYEEREIART
jgi:translation initiation factor IF-2